MTPVGSLMLSEDWMKGGVGGRWREQEEGREWELCLVRKMGKIVFFK